MTRNIPALDSNHSLSAGRIHLPISSRQYPEAVAAGAVVGPKGGATIELAPERWRPELEPLLPFIARKVFWPILPDLIPVTSWGSSLANLLAKPCWNAIRLPVIEARGNRCQICGEWQGAVECHEIWAYSLPPAGAPEGTVGVQRLIGLAAVCPDCHEMFHLGLANIRGRLEVVKRRLMAVNQWSAGEFGSYDREMAASYTARSTVNWALDLSLVAGDAPLAIKPGWTLGDEGELTGPERQYGGSSWTVIVGASYVVNGEKLAAMDPAHLSDRLLPEEGDFGFVSQMGSGVATQPAAKTPRQPPRHGDASPGVQHSQQSGHA